MGERLQRFHDGGGLKTSVDTFVHMLPRYALLFSGGGFLAGGGVTACEDYNATPHGTPWTTNSSTPDYWPLGLGVGAAASVLASAVHAGIAPLRYGQMIEDGEIAEVPYIPHVGKGVVDMLRRVLRRPLPDRRRNDGMTTGRLWAEMMSMPEEIEGSVEKPKLPPTS